MYVLNFEMEFSDFEKNSVRIQISFLQDTWLFTEDLCVNSGISGLKYFADRKRHWFERLNLIQSFSPTHSLITLYFASEFCGYALWLFHSRFVRI